MTACGYSSSIVIRPRDAIQIRLTLLSLVLTHTHTAVSSVTSGPDLPLTLNS